MGTAMQLPRGWLTILTPRDAIIPGTGGGEGFAVRELPKKAVRYNAIYCNVTDFHPI